MAERALALTDFRAMKQHGTPITMLTAYDAAFAALFDDAGIDMILVGDSLGNVVQGRQSTIQVTLEQMIYHGEMVARAVKRAFVAVDMPFLTYQVNDEEAVRNAGLLMQRTGCKAVKLEGGVHRQSTIRRIVETGIPVIGHVGLTPQSMYAFGGYKVQGRDDPERIMADAHAVQEAGAFMVVIEGMPRELAADITHMLNIPTIGIGAGVECDGQVLVSYDMLGLFEKFSPTFVRKYAGLADTVRDAVKAYAADVRARTFPSENESYK